jgi:hypothetical protein
MNDPANVRTPSEQTEHEALSQKIINTVFPQPTLAEARLNLMAASPIGATPSVFTGAVGGSQQAQDRGPHCRQHGSISLRSTPMTG